MPGIFISYRREDAGGHAGRLVDDLREHFPHVPIFQDIEGIHAGTDFVRAIEQAIATSRVMLVLIGPDWLAPETGRSHSRLHDPQDFVRWEIWSAAQHRLAIIPVLVGGAEMVAPQGLPPELGFLARINAHEQSDGRWRYDLDQLANKIATLTGFPRGSTTNPPVVTRPRPQRSHWLVVSLAVIGGLFILLVLVEIGTSESPPSPTPDPAPVPAAASMPAFLPPDVTGTWHELNATVPYVFQQHGSAVSLQVDLSFQDRLLVGSGPWTGDTLVLQLEVLSAADRQHLGNGTLTLKPSTDGHLSGVLQFGNDQQNIQLLR